MSAPNPPPNNGHTSDPLFGPNNPSPTAELTALAAHLRRMADRVEDLDTRCDQLAEILTATVLPRLTSVATDTAAQLAEHSEQVQQLLETLTKRRTVEPLNWPVMNIDQAAVAWTNLAGWIADCWALHRPAVVQLSWLHLTHHDAHQPGAGPRSTADWHTRWLPAALRAVREAIPRRGSRTCGPGQHLITDIDRLRQQPVRPVPTAAPSPPPSDQLAERQHWQTYYDAAVTADLSTR
jgi:hypothetical protein